jgi:hypothetical protein
MIQSDGSIRVVIPLMLVRYRRVSRLHIPNEVAQQSRTPQYGPRRFQHKVATLSMAAYLFYLLDQWKSAELLSASSLDRPLCSTVTTVSSRLQFPAKYRLHKAFEASDTPNQRPQHHPRTCISTYITLATGPLRSRAAIISVSLIFLR